MLSESYDLLEMLFFPLCRKMIIFFSHLKKAGIRELFAFWGKDIQLSVTHSVETKQITQAQVCRREEKDCLSLAE